MIRRKSNALNLVFKATICVLMIVLVSTVFTGCVKNYGKFTLPVDIDEKGEKITDFNKASAEVIQLKDRNNFALSISTGSDRELVYSYATICYAEDVLYIRTSKSESFELPERKIELLYYETEKGVKYRTLFYDEYYKGEKDASSDIKTLLEEKTSYLLCLELVLQHCRAENWSEAEQRFVGYEGEDVAWSLEVYSDQICLNINQKLIEFEEFDFFTAWQNNTITFYGFDQEEIEKPVKPWYSFT